MILSVSNGTKDIFIKREVKTPEELFNVITKKDYSLAVYKKNHRKETNFDGAQLLGLDFDDGLSLKDALEIFKDQWHIIGTTRNHQKPKNGVVADRFRVILKPESTISKLEDYRATLSSLLDRFKQADQKCSDGSRMFYRCNKIVQSNFEGKLEPVKKWVAPEKKEVDVISYNKGELAKATLKFLSFPVESSRDAGALSNSLLYKATVDLKEQHYTREEAFELLGRAADQFNGLTTNCETTINGVYDRDVKYDARGDEPMFTFKHPTEMSSEGQEVKWFTENLLGEGSVSLMVGAPKCGKSTLTRQLAMAAATGSKWLDRQVKKTPVLYLALEEHEGMLKKQLEHIGLTKDHDIQMHAGPARKGDVKDSLVQAINHYKSGLVIVDTLLLLAKFKDINSYNEAYEQVSPFREAARDTGAHIMLIHHSNKGGEGMNKIMGSNGLLGAVDCAIVLDYIWGEGSRRKIFSQQRGGRSFDNCVIEYKSELDIYTMVKAGVNTTKQGI